MYLNNSDSAPLIVEDFLKLQFALQEIYFHLCIKDELFCIEGKDSYQLYASLDEVSAFYDAAKAMSGGNK